MPNHNHIHKFLIIECSFLSFFYAIAGRVYNVTPYLEYHPGGIPELMRGIGRDATDLFDEVSAHAIDSMSSIQPTWTAIIKKPTLIY